MSKMLPSDNFFLHLSALLRSCWAGTFCSYILLHCLQHLLCSFTLQSLQQQKKPSSISNKFWANYEAWLFFCFKLFRYDETYQSWSNEERLISCFTKQIKQDDRRVCVKLHYSTEMEGSWINSPQ